jgi:hypothetical protein
MCPGHNGQANTTINRILDGAVALAPDVWAEWDHNLQNEVDATVLSPSITAGSTVITYGVKLSLFWQNHLVTI